MPTIAEQNFNALAASGTFTDDELSSGGQLTNAGSFNNGGAGLNFATFWFDTRGTGDGPLDGAESGDFIGVNAFSGSNAPDVAADGTLVSSGTEQNFQFNDGDGALQLLFEPIDLSGFVNRALRLDYWIADTGYEADDAFSLFVSDGVTTFTPFDVSETFLETNASPDDGTANWRTFAFDIDSAVIEGLDPSTFSLGVVVDTNSGAENIFIDNVVVEGDAETGGSGASDLFLSEIVEGSSLNKAIEIYNGTGASVDLGAYQIEIFFNGNTSAGTTIDLSGTLANGDVFVIADDGADAAILAETDLITNASLFNGDDVIALSKDGVFVDVFGQIGVDPGSEWPGGGANDTLVRKPEISSGDDDASDAFDASVEWDARPQNDFSDLGQHTFAGGGGGATPGLTLVESDGATEVSEAGATDSFTVVLDSRPTSNVTIAIASATSDAQADPSALTFTPDNFDSPQSVAVSTLDDSAEEGDVVDTLTLTASSADGDYSGLTASVSVTVLDDDGAVGVFMESFESAPGTTYTLSNEFDDGSFDFFGRFAAPDGANPARDDFQSGFDGGFAIFSQDNDGDGFDATQVITIPNIDISDLKLPSVTLSLGALNSAPSFLNYEGGDGVQIFATVDDGARELIGAFAAPESGPGDLSLDADGDGFGDGVIGLTTELQAFSFALNASGARLDLEIELTSNASFEPLAVDNVVVDAGSLVINEVIYRHSGADDTEFVELFGTPFQSLAGLSLVQVDLAGNIIFQQDFGADDALGANGYFLLGGSDVENFGATPDILLANDALSTFGESGPIDGESATFALIETDTLGATVTGAETVVDAIAFTDPSNIEATFPFNAPVVGPDGTFPPAGGARIEDGVDTNTAADWQLRSFFLGDITPTSSTSGAAGGVAVEATIPEIQGSGLSSDFAGQLVQTSGVVTAVDTNGFYFQDPEGDGDAATSDGLFVFTGGAPSVAVGDAVQVTGSVLEFGSGLGTTQISLPSDVTVLSSGNPLPAAVVLGSSGLVPPTDSIESGIDFFESLEGMLVQVEAPTAISPTDGDEIYVLPNGGENSPSLSERGTNNIGFEDLNAEKLLITRDFGILPSDALPTASVGAEFETITGVVDYTGSEYEINATEAVVVTAESPLTPEVTSIVGDDDTLTVASYNVLNLDPGDGAARFDGIADQIVNNLSSPDVIALQEIQDNSGPTDNGVVSASATLQGLVDAIFDISGTVYEFLDNDFIFNNLNGGQPGGNIRTAFLYDPSRVDLVSFEQGALLPQNDPDSPFNGGRLPLSATFTFNGDDVTVVNNHFSSKGGSASLFGSVQPTDLGQENPSINGSLNERREQAQAVNDYVDTLLAADADANIVVLGDMNEFEFVSPLDIVAGTAVSTNNGFDFAPVGDDARILTNLTTTLDANEAYTFIFEGNSQALDHALVSQNLVSQASYDIVHTNVEFTTQAADHEPLIVGLDFASASDGLDVALLNADTGARIATIENGTELSALALEGLNLTLSATVIDDGALAGLVESVTLDFNDGDVVRTENAAPYTLFGDGSSGFGGGLELSADNTLVFELFSDDDRNGGLVDTLSRSFTLVDDLPVFSADDVTIGVYDADDDTLIATLADGDAIDASLVADKSITFAAVVNDDSFFFDRIESAELDLNGDFTRTESVAPYALFGDRTRDGVTDFGGEAIALDEENTLSFSWFSQDGGDGELIGAFDVTFTLFDDSAA